jgi:hypothetical protein
MLKADLTESDIPGRTTLSTRILEMFEEYLDVLETEMRVRIKFFLSLSQDTDSS